MNMVIQKERHVLAFAVAVFILLTTGLTIFEYIKYQKDKQMHEAQIREELTTINNLKTKELADWRNSNLESTEVLNHSADFAEHVQSYIENPGDPHVRSQISSWLQVYRLHEEYESIHLLDINGNILVADSEKTIPLPKDVISHIPGLLKSHQVEIVDFYFDETHQQNRLAILIPILSQQGVKQVIGLVMVVIDPNVRIFSNLQEWPIPNESGETLLVRSERQEILVLSPLRIEYSEQFNPRYELTETSIPPLHIETDLINIVEGVDFPAPHGMVINTARAPPR